MKRLLTICLVAAFVLAVSSTAKGDLIAYWPFDKDDGTIAYDNIGLNDGTVVGATWTPGGAIGGALEFDGDGDFVEVPANNLSSDPMTISWWMNTADEMAVCIMDKAAYYETEGMEIWLYDNSGGYGYLNVRGSGSTNLASDSDYHGEWVFVTVVFDGATATVYKNGVFDVSGAIDQVVPSTHDLLIGIYGDATIWPFCGIIDEVAIWNHALSAEEVMDVYINGVPRECVPAPSGMVSWWPGDGNADDIIGGNDGTLVNGATYAAGKVGQAFSFDGVDDYVKVLAPPFPDIDSQITIDMWVNVDTVEDRKILLWKSNNYGLALGYTNVSGDPGTFGFTIKGDVWKTVSSATIPVAGQWYHIAGTFDGAELRIYLNGVLEGTLPYSGQFYSVPWTYPDVYVGGHPWSEDLTFAGDIDEVEIFNRALSAEEIQAIYNAGSAGKCIVVEIDIKPGSNEDSSNENTIPLDSQGLIPVAIFSVCGEDGIPIFDATTIDPATLELAGAEVDVRMKGKGNEFMAQKCDVDGDGCIDLIVHIATANLDPDALQEGEAVLTGETYEGKTIVGLDYITIVPVEGE